MTGLEMSQQLATPIIFSSNYLGNHNPYEPVFERDRTTKFDQPDCCKPMTYIWLSHTHKQKKPLYSQNNGNLAKTETEQVKMLKTGTNCRQCMLQAYTRHTVRIYDCLFLLYTVWREFGWNIMYFQVLSEELQNVIKQIIITICY